MHSPAFIVWLPDDITGEEQAFLTSNDLDFIGRRPAINGIPDKELAKGVDTLSIDEALIN